MYGLAATKLINDLKLKPDTVPEYAKNLIEEVKKESHCLFAENVRTSQSTRINQQSQNSQEPIVSSQTEPSNSNETSRLQLRVRPEVPDDEIDHIHEDYLDINQEDHIAMQARHTALLFNKRCLIAYHMERVDRLKELRWGFGNNLPTEIIDNLSKEELKLFTDYNENLFQYMRSLNDGEGLDLTTFMNPPKRLVVEVKCLKDYGAIDNELGMKLIKDQIYTLPLSQCEHLIHLSVLQYTDLHIKHDNKKK